MRQRGDGADPAPPNSSASTCARLNSQCTSASQVKPMPPCAWIADDVTSRAPADAAALASDAPSASRSGSASAAQAAKYVAERALSVCRSIAAQRCETAW